MTSPEVSGEFGLIAWIRERSKNGGRVGLGIGDDCASLTFTPGAEVLVTTDMLMDGRHFRLERGGRGGGRLQGDGGEPLGHRGDGGRAGRGVRGGCAAPSGPRWSWRRGSMPGWSRWPKSSA